VIVSRVGFFPSFFQLLIQFEPKAVCLSLVSLWQATWDRTYMVWSVSVTRHHETGWDQGILADQAWSAGVCSEGALKCALNSEAELRFPWNVQLNPPEFFPVCSCRQRTWNRPKLAFNTKAMYLLNCTAQSQHYTEMYAECLKVGQKGNSVGYTCSIC